MAQNPPPSAGAPPDGGPEGLEKVSVSWLILQRLEDITKRLDAVDHRFDVVDQRIDALAADMKADMAAMRAELKHDIESVRNWSLGLMLLAIVGLLAKLLVPGA